MTQATPDNRPLDPNLLDRLWDFDDPAVSEQRFRSRIDHADPESPSTHELVTQLARALGLQGRFDEAEAVLTGIASERPRVLARIALERGRLRNSSGDAATAMPHLAAALDHARTADDEFLMADAVHMLAIADTANAAHWVDEGLRIVEGTTDPRTRRWRGPLHNNLGWTLHDRGDHEAALEQFHLALAAFQAGGTATQVHNARWAVARCLRSLARYEDALTIQQRLRDEDPPDPYVDEEIAALERARGDIAGPWEDTT
jgi:tetratricopeptide (TPR) repeat protein